MEHVAPEGGAVFVGRIDTPVKHYSSGMYVRLAFAVAAHLEPEIFLVDEVLAVGDIKFQKKCPGKMGDVAGEASTVRKKPKLLSGYEVEEQNHWLKHKDNRWYPYDVDAALSCVPTSHPTIATRCFYALGCFVVRAARD